LYGLAPVLQSLIGRRLDLIAAIVTTCVALFGVSLLLQPEAITESRGFMSFLSPGTRALYQLGMTGGLAWQLGWWWTMFTAIYLHGGLLHIVFNVMVIRNLGPVAIEVYGPARTFVLFTVAGAFGFLLSNIFSPATPSIGASGSVFGLFAALIVYGNRRGSSLMSQQLWQWAIAIFVLGFVMSGVNNWAHGGGFAAGWIGAHVMGFIDEEREGNGMTLLALAFILVTLLGIFLSFTKVTTMLLGA